MGLASLFEYVYALSQNRSSVLRIFKIAHQPKQSRNLKMEYKNDYAFS